MLHSKCTFNNTINNIDDMSNITPSSGDTNTTNNINSNTWIPWRLVQKDVKYALEERAMLLYRQKILGLCKDLFKVLDIPMKKRTKVYLKRRMSLELYQGGQWYYKIMRNVITKGRRTELCQRSYWFGQS